MNQLEVLADPANLCHIRKFVEALIQESSLNEEQRYHVLLAVDEACSNVIKHAYKGEVKPDNKIKLNIEVSDNKLKIMIRDYGITVDSSVICGRDLNEVKPGGLGVHLIHGCMDNVYFNCDIKEGNELILEKNFN